MGPIAGGVIASVVVIVLILVVVVAVVLYRKSKSKKYTMPGKTQTSAILSVKG